MPLTWNEIRLRASQFSEDWKDKSKTAIEKSDAYDFMTDFFNVFGVSRKRVAILESRINIGTEKDLFGGNKSGKKGYMDLFYKGNIIIEMKSPGRDKLKAYSRAKDIEAAEHMGELHDALKENNYTGHELEMYLVRLLFCLFADDSGIFDEKKIFFKYISDTKEDGSNLAQELGLLFEMLNKPVENRQKNINEIFKKFPYVNGGLFEERLSTAAFNSKMRRTLLNCCKLDWNKIKPEIFGAMFQSIKNKEARRELGEHYTSETNILKVIKPLFLDDLWNEFNNIKFLSKVLRIQRLLEFHTKLQSLKFFDPACGCGNFLVVSYRELRLLEIEVLSEYLQDQKVLDIELMVRVNVDQFYGIEIVEFPAQIARVALWLMDHLLNTIASEKFGKYIVRIPLTATPNIIIGNALTTDWETLVPKNELNFILGNPPFVGYAWRTEEQHNDMNFVFQDEARGHMDYVAAWFKKSSMFILNTKIKTAFVSTNSICQGEQVIRLWNPIISSGIKIDFAYRTFKWSNEAKGKAAVHCVIVGFSPGGMKKNKMIFENDMFTIVNEINPYLFATPAIFINQRSKPICDVPEMSMGNMPRDGGYLLLDQDERDYIIKHEPNAKKYIRIFSMGDEFINNIPRYCLWLVNCPPNEIKKMPLVLERIENVRKLRLESKAISTRQKAATPAIFGQLSKVLDCKHYIAIPKVSSERRNYIPIGFLDLSCIPGDKLFVIPNANLYHFGIITSSMHMAWMKTVCGRLEMRYSYSNTIVYNNFSWPDPTEKQKEAIEKAAQAILDTRSKFPNSSLADLYDPLTMPPELLKMHQKLDKAVEKAYGKEFDNDTDRVAHLFYLYQKITEGLFAVKPKKRK